MTKIIIEEFVKDLKLVKVVVLEIGGHGDCSMKPSYSYKGCYDNQPLTSGYLKCCVSEDIIFQVLLTISLRKVLFILASFTFLMQPLQIYLVFFYFIKLVSSKIFNEDEHMLVQGLSN